MFLICSFLAKFWNALSHVKSQLNLKRYSQCIRYGALLCLAHNMCRPGMFFTLNLIITLVTPHFTVPYRSQTELSQTFTNLHLPIKYCRDPHLRPRSQAHTSFHRYKKQQHAQILKGLQLIEQLRFCAVLTIFTTRYQSKTDLHRTVFCESTSTSR
ncbi:hypothetical protein VCUG_02252 [Vavraia culicis subsp. floridensis]|uniref:Uncharacterized protein n=1 Tax=Vavraia culicis (isolate floridensis) TaxID=948595 RepID=L2GSH1_VAVCU|nr:uncharacterized protein VCUG_02252 [Vavraia culicis subsp. floridensis]ELA46243.1 hypothetical protein VCUG_02252 [Vavraia culicis subsp. floridensis]